MGVYITWAFGRAGNSPPATKQGRQTAYQPPRTSWSHPPRGTLKLNSDAGVFSDGSVGLGFVVRDSSGKVVMAGAKRCAAAGDNSTIIEALALRFGLENVQENGLCNIILEVDSRNLWLAVRGEMEMDPSSMLVVGDIQHLARELHYFEISLVKREANKTAHALAHYGKDEGYESVWNENFPCNWYIRNDVRLEPN
ncbi:hypothetical protein ACS0TY_023054 [Phlomoides rotata]